MTKHHRYDRHKAFALLSSRMNVSLSDIPRYLSKPKVFGTAAGMTVAFALLSFAGIPPVLLFGILMFAGAVAVVSTPQLPKRLYDEFTDEARILFSISMTERPQVMIHPHDRDVSWEEAMPLLRSGKLVFHGQYIPSVVDEILRRAQAAGTLIPVHDDPVRPNDILLTAYVCRIETQNPTPEQVAKAFITFRLFSH